MRYFKMIVCAALLLFVAGAASAQEDYLNTWAGGGPDNIPATSSPLYTVQRVAVDRSGNVYFTSQGTSQSKVWKINPSTGILTIVAGGPYYGYAGDGALAVNALLYNPIGIAVDYYGNLFIADSTDYIIREVNASSGIITTIAGTPSSPGFGGDGGPATSTAVRMYPNSVTIDTDGNLYISDYSNFRVRMVSCATVNSSGGACSPTMSQTAGYIYTIAGTGTNCSPSTAACGDGGPATSANFYYPTGMTTDAAGNLYIADQYDQRIRRIACGTGISGCTAPAGETAGDIYTVAGDGTGGYANLDGGPATSAELYYPTDVAVDNAGNLFINDYQNFRVREVSCVTTAVGGGACTPSTGQTANDIYTAVGNGTAGDGAGDNVPATSGNLYYALGVAVDSAGDIFIADQDNDRIRFVPCDTNTLTCTPPAADPTAKYIYTIAGNGTSTAYYGSGVPPLDAELNDPTQAISDPTGNIYIADRGNCAVREVSVATGNITTIAGTLGSCGFGGDGGAATSTSAHLNSPSGLALDSSGNLYIADNGNCVVREVSGGNISTIAGTHGVCSYGGDNGPATSADLYYPFGVAVDPSGNLYIADEYNHLIRKVSGGTITTFAGSHTVTAGVPGFAGDGGPATGAELYYPTEVALDSVGNLYIADQYNQRIRKVNPSGMITTVAGQSQGGYTGDGVSATESSLYYPIGVGIDLAGDILIGDYDNQRVRLVDQSGIIHTVAGNGTGGYNGNDLLATTAKLYQPYGVTVDPAGNIYEADYQTLLIRRINALTVVGAQPVSISFDTQLVGTSSSGSNVTLAANGNANISITTSAGFSETDDCPSTLNSAQTCTVTVYFSPTSSGIINGQLTVTYAGFFGPSTIINLTGTATGLSISPSPLLFGSDTDGTPTTKTVTVTGNTTYSGSPTLTGATAEYSVVSNTCTGHITTSCAIGVQFDPAAAVTYKATLVIHNNDPTSPQLVAVSGMGCSSGCSLETFSPSSINFGSQTDKVSSLATKVTFTNNNSGSLTITKPVATAGFKVNVTGLTAPVCSVTASTVVASGGSCSFNVVFDPTVTGSATGTVKTTFPADGDGNTSLTLNVSGEGSAISFTPSPLVFKGQMINTTSAKTKVTIKNVDSVTLTLTSLVASPSNFALTSVGLSPACNTSGSTVIAAGATCLVDVTFAPGATFGTVPGTITAAYTGDVNGDTGRVLTVSGVGTEMKETGALAFGTVANPNTAIKVATVTNEGTITSTITAPTITGTGAAEYSVLPYNGTNSTCLNGTVMLTHLQTCTLTVQFTPPVGSGTSYAGDLNINSTGGGPLIVAISGKN